MKKKNILPTKSKNTGTHTSSKLQQEVFHESKSRLDSWTTPVIRMQAQRQVK